MAGATAEPRTPRRARAPRAALAAAILLVGAVPLLTPNAYIHTVFILIFLLAVSASGWNIMSGYTGYVSLGHSAFIGVGAYTAGIVAERADMSPFLVAPLGGVAAALVACLLGLATRRTRGAAFVIVTFAMLELLGLVTRNLEITGGSQGFLMPLPTWQLRFQNWPFFYALYALVLLSVAMTVWIRRSKLGLGLVAIRDDEDKAAGIGVRTPVYKSLAFMASAVLVGVAGAVYGYYVSVLSVSTMFDIVLSMQIVLAALLGGRGTVWGPVLGAFILVPVIELTNTTLGGEDAGAIRLLLFGGMLVAVALLMPRGILPTVTDAWDKRRTTRGRTGARLDLEMPIPATPATLRGVPGDGPDDNLPALAVHDVTLRFGGVTALDHVSADIPQGSIVALIGPNGSGKTSLFNVIDGTYSPTSGQVLLEGRQIDRLDRTRRAHAGIGRTFQLPRLFRSLTVLENVAAVSPQFSPRLLLRSAVSGAEAERATELLEFVGMGAYVDAPASALSYGQSKLVELAQVLMLDPAVILLDEPAAGINPTLVRRLADLVSTLNDAGRTFVIVEHDMHFVLSLADRAVVLARGQVIAAGEPAAVSADPQVLEAYLGDDFALDSSDPAGVTS